MDKMKKDMKGMVKEQPSQGGRVMRQMRQKESVANALKTDHGAKLPSTKKVKKEY